MKMEEQRKKYDKEYYLKNKEKRIGQVLKNHSKNREKRLKQMKELHLKNIEKDSKKNKEYRLKNIEAIKKQQKEYKAIDWIKDNRSDFKEVCRMAGRSPEYVREKILQSLLEREKQIVNNTATIQENTSNISVYNLPRYMHSYLDRKKDDK